MYGIIDSVLSMKMDVYRQTDNQNPDTGAIVKEWNYYKTVDCHAKGMVTNSATIRSSDNQTFNNKYVNEQNIQVRTIERITTRDSKDNVIWTEINFPTETPTVFEIIGTTPITDPFGTVIAYNSALKRSENQQIGL